MSAATQTRYLGISITKQSMDFKVCAILVIGTHCIQHDNVETLDGMNKMLMR
jgi:hypothetical protein